MNPVRLFFNIDSDEKTFSGSFSFFNIKPRVEMSFPIYFSNNGPRSFTLDGHYRYFLGKQTNGFYISGFSRFARLSGTFNYDAYINNKNKTGSTYKLGAGFGIGYRIFSKRGLYWGASISIGRYLIGDNNQYASSIFLGTNDDQKIIFDIEVFKIGYAF